MKIVDDHIKQSGANGQEQKEKFLQQKIQKVAERSNAKHR